MSDLMIRSHPRYLGEHEADLCPPRHLLSASPRKHGVVRPFSRLVEEAGDGRRVVAGSGALGTSELVQKAGHCASATLPGTVVQYLVPF